MSSQKKIGRWKRFEIAFVQENRPEKSPFRTPESPASDKTRNLRKTDKATPSDRAVVEAGTTEKEATEIEMFPENATSRQVRFPVSGTPTLWEEARRQQQDAAKEAAKKCKKRR